MISKCFICKSRVFNLKGQATTVVSYSLEESAASRKLEEDHAIGNVHLRCLIESPWGNMAAQATEDYVNQDDSLITLLKTPELFVYRHDIYPYGWTTGILANGWEIFLPDDDLSRVSRFQEPGGDYLVRFIEVFNMDLEDRPEIAQKVNPILQTEGQYPLLELVNDFGLTDRLLNPDILANSRIQTTRADKIVRKKKPDKKKLYNDSIESYANYECLCPAPMIDSLFQHLKIRRK